MIIMANYATLKAAIAAAIKQNGNNEITGNLLQQQLLAMVNSLGVGYQFTGIATPLTNPGTPDQRVFYFASIPGQYVNFDCELKDGELAILVYDTGGWLKFSVGAVSEQGLQLSTMFIFDYSIQGTNWYYGYGNTHIVIPVVPGQKLQLVSAAGFTYYSFLKTYKRPLENGEIPDWTPGYTSRQYMENGQTVEIPTDCNFLVVNNPNIENNLLQHIYIDGCDALNGLWVYIHNVSKTSIKTEDLTITQSLINLADPDNIKNELIDSTGAISPTDGSWQAIEIPITSDDFGKKITVGGFYLGRTGYAAFYNDTTFVSFFSIDDADGDQHPTTFTIPSSGVTRLIVDIKSPMSPTNPYLNLMANFGEELLPYEPYKMVTKINGYGLGGSIDSQTLHQIELQIEEINDNLVNVIYDLPVSDGTDIQTGYAYINSVDGVVKVKL